MRGRHGTRETHEYARIAPAWKRGGAMSFSRRTVRRLAAVLAVLAVVCAVVAIIEGANIGLVIVTVFFAWACGVFTTQGWWWWAHENPPTS